MEANFLGRLAASGATKSLMMIGFGRCSSREGKQSKGKRVASGQGKE
jgi:hypothetical protein